MENPGFRFLVNLERLCIVKTCTARNQWRLLYIEGLLRVKTRKNFFLYKGSLSF